MLLTEKSQQIEKAEAARNALDELCGCFQCIGCPFNQPGGLCKLSLRDTQGVPAIIDKIANQ